MALVHCTQAQQAAPQQCNWSAWSCGPCSVQCIWGTEQCTRSCASGATNTKTQPCTKGLSSSWTAWTESSCSASCGSGIITRMRQCRGCFLQGMCPNGAVETEIAPCFFGVPYAWTPWSAWSPCSSQCSTGTYNRTRICQGTCSAGSNSCIPDVEDTQTGDCSGRTPGTWTAWSAWVPCEGCGLGRRRQTRQCEGSCDGTCSVGAADEKIELCAESKTASWSS